MVTIVPKTEGTVTRLPPCSFYLPGARTPPIQPPGMAALLYCKAVKRGKSRALGLGFV